MSSSFFSLTPERVLGSVESSGLRCTGRCLTLNSFENRVYDVELEVEDSQNRRIAKFYRPHRWSPEQILEEHEFLEELEHAEIPVVAPIRFPDGHTLHRDSNTGIYFALFPRVGGRAPDELTDEQLIRIGRLIGRIHNVGAQKKSQHRTTLSPETYGLANLKYLVDHHQIPLEIQSRYVKAVEKIIQTSAPWFGEATQLRLHGDCHLGNLLWNQQGPFFLDFDDMVKGPAVQDIWLINPGRDPESQRERERVLEGYREFRHFDQTNLRLVEPLRALRIIHFSAWIARRWEDPAFPQAFPNFGSHQYWAEEVSDLEELLTLIAP